MGGGPKASSNRKLAKSKRAIVALLVFAGASVGSANAEDAWLRDIRVDEGTGIVAHLHVPFTRFTEKERPKVGVAVSSPQYMGTRGDLTKFTWDDSVLLNLDVSASGIDGLNVGGIGASAFKEKVLSVTNDDPQPNEIQGFTIGRGLSVKPWYGLGLQDEAPPPSPRLGAGE